ncbi:MAG: hypothetical protein AB1758_12195 [Candidatus Eremiobacterota bacterium]
MTCSETRSRAVRDLDQLAVFFYVLAGVSAVLSLFPLIHVAMGLWFMLTPPSGPNPPPAWFGGIFVAVGLLAIAVGMTFSWFLYYSGRCIQARRRYTLIQVASALSLMNMPVGTALGVYSLILLNREDVRALFRHDL